jgi:hypothetical protein
MLVTNWKLGRLKVGYSGSYSDSRCLVMIEPFCLITFYEFAYMRLFFSKLLDCDKAE